MYQCTVTCIERFAFHILAPRGSKVFVHAVRYEWLCPRWAFGRCPSESSACRETVYIYSTGHAESLAGRLLEPGHAGRPETTTKRDSKDSSKSASRANSGTAREAAKGKKGKSEFVLASKRRRGLCCAGLRAQMHESESLNQPSRWPVSNRRIASEQQM